MGQAQHDKIKVAHEEFAAIFALGANFFSQGQYRKAQVIFAGLMALDATNEQASIAYGESLLMAGQVQKALYHFIRAKKRFASRAFEAGLLKANILLKKTGFNH
jgi:tetratricopeptide (TPR) repeat protein